MPWVMGNMGTGREPTFTTSRRKKYEGNTHIRNGYLMTLRELGVATQNDDDENLWSVDLPKALSLLYTQDQKSFCSMIGKGHHQETYRSEWPELTEKDTKKIDQAYKRSLKPRKPRKRKVPTNDDDQTTTKTVAVENDDGTVESTAASVTTNDTNEEEETETMEAVVTEVTE